MLLYVLFKIHFIYIYLRNENLEKHLQIFTRIEIKSKTLIWNMFFFTQAWLWLYIILKKNVKIFYIRWIPYEKIYISCTPTLLLRRDEGK